MKQHNINYRLYFIFQRSYKIKIDEVEELSNLLLNKGMALKCRAIT